MTPPAGTRNNKVREICKLLESMHNYDRFTVFTDCMESMAIAISNTVDLPHREEREARYMTHATKYGSAGMGKFAEVLALTIEALEEGPRDVLGEVFHKMELHNEARGQFFTPYGLCQAMAQMTVGDKDLAKEVEAKGFITAHEPACGSGAMVIALAEAMQQKGINYQQQLHVTAIDIDSRAAHMAYVQLSLMHIPAHVVVGNTLSGEVREHWFTPAHIFGGWDFRLHAREQQQTPEQMKEVQEVKPVKVAPSPVEQMGFDFSLGDQEQQTRGTVVSEPQHTTEAAGRIRNAITRTVDSFRRDNNREKFPGEEYVVRMRPDGQPDLFLSASGIRDETQPAFDVLENAALFDIWDGPEWMKGAKNKGLVPEDVTIDVVSRAKAEAAVAHHQAVAAEGAARKAERAAREEEWAQQVAEETTERLKEYEAYGPANVTAEFINADRFGTAELMEAVSRDWAEIDESVRREVLVHFAKRAAFWPPDEIGNARPIYDVASDSERAIFEQARSEYEEWEQQRHYGPLPDEPATYANENKLMNDYATYGDDVLRSAGAREAQELHDFAHQLHDQIDWQNPDRELLEEYHAAQLEADRAAEEIGVDTDDLCQDIPDRPEIPDRKLEDRKLEDRKLEDRSLDRGSGNGNGWSM